MSSNGRHYYCVCDNCKACLVDILVSDAGADISWRVAAANCPFCDDNGLAHLGGSRPIDIHGLFHPGGYGAPREGSDEDDIPSTQIDDSDVDGDLVLFKVKKYAKDSRPYPVPLP